jgi:HrpA-like RNA helicase
MSSFWKPSQHQPQPQQQQNQPAPPISYRRLRQNLDEIDTNEDDDHHHHPNDNTYASIQEHRISLPIYKHRKQIIYAVEHYGITIIVGETGNKHEQTKQTKHNTMFW